MAEEEERRKDPWGPGMDSGRGGGVHEMEEVLGVRRGARRRVRRAVRRVSEWLF